MLDSGNSAHAIEPRSHVKPTRSPVGGRPPYGLVRVSQIRGAMFSRIQSIAAKVSFITYLRTPDGLRVSGFGLAEVMFGDGEKVFD